MRKNTAAVMLFILIFLTSAYVLYRSVKHQKPEGQQVSSEKQKENEKKRSSDGHTEEYTEEKEKRGLQGKMDISFQDYKELYQKYSPVHLREFYKEIHCEKRGENFGVSIVEFIFLKKSKDGSLRPFIVDFLGYEHLQMNESCGAKGGQLSTGGKGSFRIRFSVIRDCHKCPRVLVPGRRYRFDEFKQIGEVDYHFEMPKEEKLDFVPLDSDREPKVYRYPILVNDIRKTKQEDEYQTQRKDVTFHIQNAISSFPQSKSGEIDQVVVGYKLKNYFFTQKGVNQSGDYQLDIRVKKDENVFGGTIKVFGIVRSSSREPRDDHRSNMAGKQLLMYKPDIQSENIDMSEELTYRYNPDETVNKEIKLKPLFQKKNLEIPENDLGSVILAKVYSGRKKKKRVIRINENPPYKKNGEWYVQLEAPPGDYVLGIELADLLIKDFKWPPEKSAEEQGGGSQENK